MKKVFFLFLVAVIVVAIPLTGARNETVNVVKHQPCWCIQNANSMLVANEITAGNSNVIEFTGSGIEMVIQS